MTKIAASARSGSSTYPGAVPHMDRSMRANTRPSPAWLYLFEFFVLLCINSSKAARKHPQPTTSQQAAAAHWLGAQRLLPALPCATLHMQPCCNPQAADHSRSLMAN